MTIGDRLWFEYRGGRVQDRAIGRFPRVGVEYAGEWAKVLWRFRLQPISV